MVLESLYKPMCFVLMVFGFLASLMGLCLLLGYIWWKLLEISKRGKRWHQYIKSHKEEFLRWGIEKNKEM